MINQILRPSDRAQPKRRLNPVLSYFKNTYPLTQEFLDGAVDETGTHGWTPPPAGWVLYQLVHRHKPERILEVGLLIGLSSLWIGQACEDEGIQPERVLISSEHGHVRTTRYNLRLAGWSDNCLYVVGNSHEVLPKLLEDKVKPFDFAYIDAGHAYNDCKPDFVQTKQLCSERGVITGDDCFGQVSENDTVFRALLEEAEPADFWNQAKEREWKKQGLPFEAAPDRAAWTFEHYHARVFALRRK